MSDKKYYWLKLQSDFFNQKEIKKLRRIAGGDTYTIIYLKMQLLSLKTDGVLYFEGVEDNFADELALQIDEEPENIKVTVLYLQKHGLLVEVNEEHYILPQTIQSIGSETQVAERVRRHRKKEKALQCNDTVTNCNDIKIYIRDIDIDKEKKKYIFSSEQAELAGLLKDKILSNNRNAKVPDKLDNWANTMRLMIEQDKRTAEDIKVVIEWCQQDSFWSTNILSADKLRKQFDQLKMKMSKNKKPAEDKFNWEGIE